MQKTTKQFPTLAVAGVATGVVLEHKGFSGIHEVMDHLFPGIMTLGCAMMSDAASAEIYRQHPDLKAYIDGLGDLDFGKHWQSVASGIRKLFGETLSVAGPLAMSPSEIAIAASIQKEA